jgi:hypothetical protein
MKIEQYIKEAGSKEGLPTLDGRSDKEGNPLRRNSTISNEK